MLLTWFIFLITYLYDMYFFVFQSGVLFINGLRHDIFSGENVIGRDEDCDIVISNAVS